jgi:hypothetical protein
MEDRLIDPNDIVSAILAIIVIYEGAFSFLAIVLETVLT